MKKFLYDILENDRSSYFIFYNSFSFSLILISVILNVYDEIFEFSTKIHPLIVKIEYAVSFLIAFELVGRFIITENKLKYLTNPLTVVDIFALIPSFHAIRFIRYIVLVSRILRISYRYKFFFEFTFRIIREIYYEIFFVFSFFFVIFFSILLFVFSVEHTGGNEKIKTLFDAIYYVVITATTVGYGDITPITTHGRVLAMFLGITGLLLFSLLTAIISTGFVQYVNMLKLGMLSFKEMKNHIVICGWNETGEVILEELKKFYEEKKERMKPVVVITSQEITPEGDFYYKKGDFAKEEVLKNAGVENADIVIILAEKLPQLTEDSIDARSILTAMLVRDLNHGVNIIVEILSRENANTLKRKKIADYIIVDGEIVGSMISKFIRRREFPEILDFLMDKAEFYEIPAKEEKTVEEILRSLREYGLIGIKRGEDLILFPPLDFEVLPEDNLILIKKKA